MSEKLYAAFHEPRSPLYQAVETTVWVLIVISIGLLFLEPLVASDPVASRIVKGIDKVLLVVFALEVALRIGTYRPTALEVFDRPPLGRLRTHLVGRLRFALRPMMLIDLVTVLALVPALRGLRAVRLLRLLRTVRVFRYGNPFQGLISAFNHDRLLFLFAFSVLGVQVILGGISLYLVEGAQHPSVDSVSDALWWALVTITTVGFGDITPVTSLGRIVGSVLMVGGMFTLALFAGIVGRTLLNAVLSIREEQFRMSDYVNHIVVCGHQPGDTLLFDILKKEIDSGRQQVVLFSPGERDPNLPPEFLWVQGEPTKESELAKVRLTHASTVIVAGSRKLHPQRADAVSILTAFTVRSYMQKTKEAAARKHPLKVIVEILDSENVEHAKAAGADEVVETRRLGYSMLSHAVLFPGVAHAASAIVFNRDQNLYVGRIPAIVSDARTFDEVSEVVRASTGALIVGLRDPVTGEQWVNPSATQRVPRNLELLYLAEKPVLGGK